MRTKDTRRYAWFGVFSVMVLLAGACGDDDETANTTTASSTAPATVDSTTAPGMGSNVESLSYLIQGLLTTEQIGGSWVDLLDTRPR